MATRRRAVLSESQQEAAEQADGTVETEGTVEGAEGTETEAGAESAAPAPSTPEEPDLTAFEAAVETAVEAMDSSTGTVDQANQSTVLAEYRKLEGVRARNAAKRVIENGMKEAVNSMEIATAKAYMQLSNAVVNAGGSSTGTGSGAVRKPTDPTEAFVVDAVRLKLAMAALDGMRGEDVAEDWRDRVNAKYNQVSIQLEPYGAWLNRSPVEEGAEDQPEPEVDPLVRAAFKTALGKAAGIVTSTGKPKAPRSTGDGTRHNVAKHILEAFADKPVGHFIKVGDLVNFKSTEYGDTKPSSGAITARLFPTNKEGKVKPTSVPGIEAFRNGNGETGARKIA